MSAENEIKAMGAVAAALELLDDEGRARVLHWAASHYGLTGLAHGPIFRGGKSWTSSNASPQVSGAYETFAELFNAAGPKTEKDKSLVAAYWVQICEGVESFQSQALNDSLKDLGHGIGNITEALSQLKNDRPALLLQLKKSGNSRQARKTYKLTQEGIKRVDMMTQGAPSD